MDEDFHAVERTGTEKARMKKRLDRKSTRLNSSHLVISYAVFCLKKKKNIIFIFSVPRRNVSDKPCIPFMKPVDNDSSTSSVTTTGSIAPSAFNGSIIRDTTPIRM